MKKGVSVKVIKRFSIFLSVLIIVLSFSACSAKKLQKDNRIIITGIKTAESMYMDGDRDVTSSGTEISRDLQEKLEEYSGQKVWFRVIVSFTNFTYYENLCDDSGENDFNVFMKNFVKSELDYASSIGAMNIVETENTQSDFSRGYYHYMEVTADMLNRIFPRKTMSFYIAPPARVEGYSEKISDTLTDSISKMNDTDAIEVAAVSVYDNYSYYAFRQNIGVNFLYNNNLFTVFSQGYEKTYVESDTLLERTMVDIMTRNGILEKRVVSDDLPEIGFGEVLYPHAASLEDIPVGFNAVLTKTEILKLAEDEEIKVIYLAPERN